MTQIQFCFEHRIFCSEFKLIEWFAFDGFFVYFFIFFSKSSLGVYVCVFMSFFAIQVCAIFRALHDYSEWDLANCAFCCISVWVFELHLQIRATVNCDWHHLNCILKWFITHWKHFDLLFCYQSKEQTTHTHTKVKKKKKTTLVAWQQRILWCILLVIIWSNCEQSIKSGIFSALIYINWFDLLE